MTRLIRAAEFCFALALRIVPRRYRFQTTLLLARATVPLFIRTAAYREQSIKNFHRPDEIVLFLLLNALTKNCTRFDLEIFAEGYEHFERAYAKGKGVLVTGHHAALTLLMVRFFHDKDLNPVVITPDQNLRVPGTAVQAHTIQPSHMFLVHLRTQLRAGRVICAMPDRAKHHHQRTIEFATPAGPVIMAPAIIEVAARCGAAVLFTEVRLEGRRLVTTIAAASDASAFIEDFKSFVRAHGAACQRSVEFTNSLLNPAGRPKMMLSQMRLTDISGPRLVIIAAVFHVFLAILLFVAGRAGVAPRFIDRDGIMGSFAFDSYDYQRGAIETSELLRGGNLRAWATAAQPLHVKLIAVPFALLSPVFGYSTLSAEPYNVVCYLAIVALVFELGSELSSRRAGVLSAVVVGLWPTFLLHTLQLLKDPLFITAVLTAVWCAITLLVRTYRPAASAGVSVMAVLLLLLLALVRFSAVLLLAAVAVLILGLLVVRQARERRLLFWNMMPAIAICVVGLSLLPFISGKNIPCTKKYPSDQVGPLKNVSDPSAQVPTLVRLITSRRVVGDKLARRISSMRSRFAASYSEAGSLLDAQAEFRNVNDLLRYVPRALAIGMWAPFPSMWLSAGRRVGNVGKIVSGLETLAIYVLQVLAALALVREPRRLSLWFVVAIVVCGVTAIAFVVPNAGAIYRFRYVFWILLIVVAMSGLFAKQRELKQVMITVAIAFVLAVTHGCSSSAPALKTSKLALTNFTGTAFSAIYLSPASASDWQENLLISSRHRDGDTLEIQFEPNEQNVAWDLKVQGIDGHYAEWKNLKFDGVSEITLVLKLSSSTPVVVAEIE